DAARTAEIGDPRLGADAGAGEDHRALRPLDQPGEGGDAIVIVHGVYSRKCAGTRQARREPAKLRPMTKLLLVRHGHVEGISPERFRGRAELKLTATGRREAELTAARIAATWRPAAIYTSPMGRCIDTGAAIGKPFGLSSSAMPGLNDIDYGEWQGLTTDEARARWPGEIDTWHRHPDWAAIPRGESLQQVLSRSVAALRDVVQRHGDDAVVLVAHDSV